MRSNEKYSYSKYRNTEARPQGSGKVFVSKKIDYSFNPVVYLPAKFWGNVVFLLLILSCIWVLLFSNYFKIKNVIVEGNALIPASEIEKNVSKGENIFRFNVVSAREKVLLASPVIEDVAIYRGIPNALKVVVLERKPEIIWQSADKYYLIDGAGIVDKQIDPQEKTDLIHIVDQKNMPVVVGSQLLSAGFIEFAKNINSKFFETVNFHPIGYYITETTFDLYVLTDGGFFTKFDTTRSAEKQLSDLKNIIIAYKPNIREYVDVRVNGWAYYK